MTKVSVTEGKLAIDVQGLHKLWSFKSRLEIPLEHVRQVRTAADERVAGIRYPGTQLPGILTAGTFYQQGKKVFWDVHDYTRAIAIDLRDDSFSTLIIEVADPAATIEQIEHALTPANI
jgi:hypothetical protein